MNTSLFVDYYYSKIAVFGKKFVINSKIADDENDKDLKRYGKLLGQIGKLGQEFDPDLFDLDSDFGKSYQTELQRTRQRDKIKTLNARQRRLIIQLNDFLYTALTRHSFELEDQDIKVGIFFMSGIPHLHHSNGESFSQVCQKRFAEAFFPEEIESGNLAV